MSDFAEAKLIDVDAEQATEFVVQFNPSSLKLQMKNSTDGARSQGRQKEQFNGSASTTLSADLEFDTTDFESADGDDGIYDVRRMTDRVRHFMRPRKGGSEAAPPRVAFKWGTFELTGVMESLSEDLTFFSKEGIPLHAKVSIQIAGQEPEFAAMEIGSGAKPRKHAPPSGSTPDDFRPGTGGHLRQRVDDTIREALDGESASEFLRRLGQPPEAWRAVASAIGDDFELAGGAAVGLPAGLGEPGSTRAASPRSDQRRDATDALAGEADGLDAGLALSAAGGISAGSVALARRDATQRIDESRNSFGSDVRVDPASTGTKPGRTATEGVTRAFGVGIPLRDAITMASAGVIAGNALRSNVAPWEGLPPTAGDRAGSATRATCRCERCTPGMNARYTR